MLSRASNRSPSAVGERSASSTFSRSRTTSLMSDYPDLVNSPIADTAPSGFCQRPLVITSPNPSPADSSTTRPRSNTQTLQLSNRPLPRPKTMFLARDDLSSLRRLLPSERESRQLLVDFLREGPPRPPSPASKLTGNARRPPLKPSGSLPVPSLVPTPSPTPTATISKIDEATRLTSFDEPGYWTFDNAARSPLPNPQGSVRSESGYWSYGSRWDWTNNNENEDEFRGGEEEEEERKSREIWRKWKGWVREKRTAA
jgi:hypothetical protein